MLYINSNGELDNVFLSDLDKTQITIGSRTNKGVVKNITMSGNWVVDGNVIGRWRSVLKIEGKFYFF